MAMERSTRAPDGVHGAGPPVETVSCPRSCFQFPESRFVNTMNRPALDFRHPLQSIPSAWVPSWCPSPSRSSCSGGSCRWSIEPCFGSRVTKGVRWSSSLPAALWARPAGYREALLLAAAEEGLGRPPLSGEDPEPPSSRRRCTAASGQRLVPLPPVVMHRATGSCSRCPMASSSASFREGCMHSRFPPGVVGARSWRTGGPTMPLALLAVAPTLIWRRSLPP